MHIFNHLRTDVLVQFAGQGTVLHHEVLLHGGGSDLDVERLVLDEDVGGIALDEGTHDEGPRLNQTVLIVGRFNAVDAHELSDDVFYLLSITSSHIPIIQVSLSAPHFSPFHLEYLIITLRALQNLVEVPAVGVGDEDLAEGIARDQIDDLLHTLGIELVEDVVEQEQGRGLAARPLQEVELRQLQRDDIGLVLPLRALALDGIAAQRHLQLILVDAVERVAHDAVLLTVALNDVEQRTPLTMARVVERHLLVAARYEAVEALEHGDEFLHECLPLPIDALAVLRHHRLIDADDFLVRLLLRLQHRIALLQRLVVGRERRHVFRVVLRDDDVHQPPPLIAAARDEIRVVGRSDDDGQQPDVFRQPLILLLVPLHMLLLMHLHADGDFLLHPIQVVDALHHHHLLAVTDVHRVDGVRHALRQREEVDGIEHIRLALAVMSDEAVHLGRELQFRRRDVAIVQYGQPFQNHGAKVQKIIGRFAQNYKKIESEN